MNTSLESFLEESVSDADLSTFYNLIVDMLKFYKAKDFFYLEITNKWDSLSPIQKRLIAFGVRSQYKDSFMDVVSSFLCFLDDPLSFQESLESSIDSSKD